MKSQLKISYGEIISLENLLLAWQEFLPGKINKKDVQVFGKELIMNLYKLHQDLADKIYQHMNYTAFNISDPKPRNIHKAAVRDQVLRNTTKRRMFKGILKRPKNETLQSYLGLISYGNTFELQQEVLNWYGLLCGETKN